MGQLQVIDNLEKRSVRIQARAGVDVELDVGWLWLVPDVKGDVAGLNHHHCSQALVARLVYIVHEWASDSVHADVFDQALEPLLHLSFVRNRKRRLGVDEKMVVLDGFHGSTSAC